MLEKKPYSNSHFNLLKNNPIKGLHPTLLAFAIAQTLTLSTGTQAANIVVNTTLDVSAADANCSLREAVTSVMLSSVATTGCVNSGAAFGTDDQINFSVDTVNLTTSDLYISKSLSIQGGNNGVSISGDQTARLLELQAGLSNSTVTLNNLTLSNGAAVSGGAILVGNNVTLNMNNSTVTGNQAFAGGGIYAGEGAAAAAVPGAAPVPVGDATLNLSNSKVVNNTAFYGGGITAFGPVNLTNSSVSDNNAQAVAGGIYVIEGALSLNQSTVSNNTAVGLAGGIIVKNGLISLDNSTVSNNATEGAAGGIAIISASPSSFVNSTVSNNTALAGGGLYIGGATVIMNNSIIANSTGGDCYNGGGTITANNQNIIEDGSCGTQALSVNPLLGPLADNGGPTKTHALLKGSPAINAGDNVICAAAPINNFDQRGERRPARGICDMGAYEFGTESTPFVIPLSNGKVISFDL